MVVVGTGSCTISCKTHLHSTRPSPHSRTHQTMLSTATMRRFRSVVYLNNAGCAFLSRGESQAASQVLNYALALMQSMSPNSNDVGNDYLLFQDSYINVKLQETAQNLARCPMEMDVARALQWHKVEVINFDGLLHSLVCRNDCSDAESSVALHIDYTYFEDSPENMHEIVPTILLSNFAVSRLACSSLHPSNALLDCTWKLLSTAKTVLGLPCKSISQVTDAHLFVGIVLSRNLCAILESGGVLDKLSLERHQIASLQALARCFVETERDPGALAGAA
jgi:hypothetical protein